MQHRLLSVPAILTAGLLFAACDKPPASTPATGVPSAPGSQTAKPAPADPQTGKPVPGKAAEPEAPAEADAANTPTTPPAGNADSATPAKDSSGSKPADSTKASTKSPGPEGRPAQAFTECQRSEIFAEGRCYANLDAACSAIGCTDDCRVTKSMPGQAACMSKSKDTGKTPRRLPTNGRPAQSFSNCQKNETFADGHCYRNFETACKALGCSGQCIQLKSIPAQARCR